MVRTQGCLLSFSLPWQCEVFPKAVADLRCAKVKPRTLLEETWDCEEQGLDCFQSFRDLARSEIAGTVSCQERVGR